MRFLLFACCIALAAGPARSMVLDETPETPSGQSQAQRLRDSKAAPNSVLGDYGAELGRGLAESLDSSRTRGTVVVTALPTHFAGKCLNKRYGEAGRHPVTYSNGEAGMVTVECSRHCWQVQVFPGGRSGTNCGEFQAGVWATSSGWLNQPQARLVDVVNFINKF
ncbi:hypothetical protein [Azospirillum argentinense]